MTLACYARDKGMSREKFYELKELIMEYAVTIVHGIKDSGKYTINSGIYYPIVDILQYIPIGDDSELYPYVIQELKGHEVEFRENNEYWRL